MPRMQTLRSSPHHLLFYCPSFVFVTVNSSVRRIASVSMRYPSFPLPIPLEETQRRREWPRNESHNWCSRECKGSWTCVVTPEYCLALLIAVLQMEQCTSFVSPYCYPYTTPSGCTFLLSHFHHLAMANGSFPSGACILNQMSRPISNATKHTTLQETAAGSSQQLSRGSEGNE